MSKKFIVLSVGVIIALIFCSVIMILATKSKSSVDNSMGQYDEIISQHGDIKYSIYDGSSVSGSEVVSLIKGISSNDEISIVVTNGYGAAKTYTYENVKATGSTVLSDIADKSKSESYINPNASFMGKITKDKNGVIVAISFTQEK